MWKLKQIRVNDLLIILFLFYLEIIKTLFSKTARPRKSIDSTSSQSPERSRTRSRSSGVSQSQRKYIIVAN